MNGVGFPGEQVTVMPHALPRARRGGMRMSRASGLREENRPHR